MPLADRVPTLLPCAETCMHAGRNKLTCLLEHGGRVADPCPPLHPAVLIAHLFVRHVISVLWFAVFLLLDFDCYMPFAWTRLSRLISRPRLPCAWTRLAWLVSRGRRLPAWCL